MSSHRDDSLTFVDTPRDDPWRCDLASPLPVVDDVKGFPNFDILTELGRGSGGQVFLARQSSLGDRLVVLKVIPSDETEHLSLARLQHTNIVPLYDAFHDLDTRRRALCMPYFGSTTLHHVFAAMRPIPPGRRRGADVLAALESRERDVPAPPAERKALPEWSNASYVEALCHIGAALAQALADAHDHGLLHLDLKPSNVLLTIDGRPMLLDFHLARPPLAPGDAPPLFFGGSPPYMSPEQVSACRDVTQQEPIRLPLDARADVFSLGMLLYVGLADDVPPENSPQGLVAHLLSRNPQVSVGLADIVARCLAHDPADRYQNAKHLAEDLRRHAHFEPLAHVANRSWAERWRKWRRRRPSALPLLALGLSLGFALVGSFVYFQATVTEWRRSAETMFLQGQVHLQERRFDSAVEAFANGRDLVPAGNESLQRGLDRGLATARRAKQAKEATDIVDAMRLAMFSEPIDYRALIVHDVNGKAVWSKRESLLDVSLAPHDARLDAAVRRELTELALDWADIHVRLAPPGREGEYRDAARAMLEEARQIAPSQRIIDWRLERIPDVEFATPWEWYCAGQASLREGQTERAFDCLGRALHGEPSDYWSNFARGVCAMKLGRPAEALAPLSICIGQRPNNEAPFVRRGQAFAALGQWKDAIRDFDRALRLRPNVPDVLLDRGVAHLASGSQAAARDDFHQALAAGASNDRVGPLLRRTENN